MRLISLATGMFVQQLIWVNKEQVKGKALCVIYVVCYVVIIEITWISDEITKEMKRLLRPICRLCLIPCWSINVMAKTLPIPYPNGPEAGREAGWGSEFVPLKKRQAGSFILLHKISRTACCFGIRTFLKQYSCYESATNWYTDHQYLAQYSDIINNLQEIPLIFCNYAVRSCGTWRKGPGQSPCNGLSISDLELYVTETSTGVCDPITD